MNSHIIIFLINIVAHCSAATRGIVLPSRYFNCIPMCSQASTQRRPSSIVRHPLRDHPIVIFCSLVNRDSAESPRNFVLQRRHLRPADKEYPARSFRLLSRSSCSIKQRKRVLVSSAKSKLIISSTVIASFAFKSDLSLELNFDQEPKRPGFSLIRAEPSPPPRTC